MSEETIHGIVSGKVQDVWYRANTQAKANELNITGWVKNLPDGRVELTASGSPQALSQLEKWLWQGPEQAKVEDVQIEKIDNNQFNSFEIV